MARGGEQIIPRPPGTRVIESSPWDGIGADHVALERITRTLAVGRGSGHPLLLPPELASRGRAAVLIPLYLDDAGSTRVVLTRRSGGMRSHRGEVAFPGGRVDDGETPDQAALREAHEEIGLPPLHVRIIGELEPLTTRVSNAAITPFVGIVDVLPLLVPSPREVARIFDVALLELADPICYREELWPVTEGHMPMHLFEVEGETIWGATARMLHALLTLLHV